MVFHLENDPPNHFVAKTYLVLAYLPFPTVGGPIRAPKWSHIHPRNSFFPSIFVFVAYVWYFTPKMIPQIISYLGLAYLPFPTIGGPIRAPKWPHIHPRNSCFPIISVFVANIWYFTPKMTPQTISLLKSYQTYLGLTYLPDYRGPHQRLKAATHTPKNQLFPLKGLL